MKWKILVVEDNPIALRVAQLVLNKLQCQIDLVSTGADAVRCAENNHYDLIFMDIGLPDFDGIEATRRIRNSALIKHQAPIIALTANFDESHKASYIEAGLNDFLSKPLMQENAELMLKKWVS